MAKHNKYNLKNTSAQELARVAGAYAAESWGDVNSQVKMRGRNLWWFNCSGHGGFVALVGFGSEIAVPVDRKSELEWGNGAKLYAFEEDCDWAVPLYFNEDAVDWALAKEVFGSKMDKPTLMTYIVKAIADYNGDLVKKEHLFWSRWYLESQLEEAMGESSEDGNGNWRQLSIQWIEKRIAKLNMLERCGTE